MFAHKVHFLVDRLDACHICLCIVSEFDLLSASHAFCAPVEITEINRTSDFSCDCVEACLPTFYWFAGSFRCKGEVYHVLALHLLDDAEYDVAATFSVDRDASKLAEQPSERTPEKFALYHAVRLAAHRCIIKV